VVGGGGEDELRDEGRPGGRTALYDDDPDDPLEGGPDTHIDRRPFDAPEPSERFAVHKLGYDRHRDWGATRSLFSPALDFREGAGLILGGGTTWTDYGFRHMPYESRLSITGLVSTKTGGLGVDARYERWLENEPVAVRAHARATQFEAVRFYGYGNDTPSLPEDDALILRDEATVELALAVQTPEWHASIGPVARYLDPAVPAANPAGPGLPGTAALFEAGGRARAGLELVDDASLPTRGVRLDLEAIGFPASGDQTDSWARAGAEVRGYIAAPVLTRPVLAVRVGGTRAWGEFPVHGAPRVGGSQTVRGYRWQRFAGDAAAYGGVELRVPLFRANLYLARGRLGVIGLADAGRVWVDGESAGDWHTGHGAGLFFETLETAVHALWVRGEEDRVYVGLGLPF
jgi:hypothetical protein